jgi:hypothetical protein
VLISRCAIAYAHERSLQALLGIALSLNSDAAAAQRVALIVPTVSALFAPAQAFSEAGKAITKYGAPDAGNADRNAPDATGTDRPNAHQSIPTPRIAGTSLPSRPQGRWSDHATTPRAS